jgi:intracellular sulfur oxidation DsrE/DsrF family protein
MDLVVDRVDLVDEGANSAAFIKLYKRKEMETDMDFNEIISKLKPEHAEIIQAEIAKARAEVPEEVATELSDTREKLEITETELTKMKEEVKKSKEPAQEENFEEVLKSLDPAVQKVFKSLQAQKEAAEQVAKQLKEQKEEEEAIAKAKALKALPVEEDKLVQVVKGVSDDVYEILKSAAKVLEESDIFEEVGKGKGDAGTVDAWSRIEKKAGEIAKRDGITVEKAIGVVINENPELYKEYLNGGAK